MLACPPGNNTVAEECAIPQSRIAAPKGIAAPKHFHSALQLREAPLLLSCMETQACITSAKCLNITRVIIVKTANIIIVKHVNTICFHVCLLSMEMPPRLHALVCLPAVRFIRDLGKDTMKCDTQQSKHARP